MIKMVVRVDANPIMIKWAREDAGFSLDELPQSLKKLKNGKLVKKNQHGMICEI